MSENTIFIKKYDAQEKRLAIKEREVWRYSGYLGLTDPTQQVEENLREIFLQAAEELKNAFSYKVCYRRVEIEWEDQMPVLPFYSDSKDLAKCIKGCEEVVLFAATIGLEIDRHIAKNQRISPTKALMMQAYGAERVESLCDAFCEEMREVVKAEGKQCTPRFSPGYGDLPLETQKDFFRLLDCNRQIGISLNDSLLMTPSKSVTAVFGIGHCLENRTEHKCADCGKKDCSYRVAGQDMEQNDGRAGK